jgi:phage FluMu protein Com
LDDLDRIRCAKCDRGLETTDVTGDYLGYKFPVQLMGCPSCGQVYVPEDLVRTKIAEVEALLEQK